LNIDSLSSYKYKEYDDIENEYKYILQVMDFVHVENLIVEEEHLLTIEKKIMMIKIENKFNYFKWSLRTIIRNKKIMYKYS
jgi:hypothetical protein